MAYNEQSPRTAVSLQLFCPVSKGLTLILNANNIHKSEEGGHTRCVVADGPDKKA